MYSFYVGASIMIAEAVPTALSNYNKNCTHTYIYLCIYIYINIPHIPIL